MVKISELYEKVKADEVLQAEFTEIINGGTADNVEEVREKVVAFAKKQGYDVTFGEIVAFFDNKAEQGHEISEVELDLVAGGKSNPINTSVIAINHTCAVETVFDWVFGDKQDCTS